jgi:predicted dehydrogenase
MLRFGIIGYGNIGKVHAGYFTAGKIPRARLTAVSGSAVKDTTLPDGVKGFPAAEALLDSGLVDAVIVATPHPTHRALGEQVLQRGLHLMMEKPLTATKSDAEQLLRLPRRAGQQFGVMLNVRVHPQLVRLKQLLTDGRLGAVQRIHWTITNWYRPEAYYRQSAWRATWRGEGGGVLVNQALHNLDVLGWLAGRPRAVRAFCRFGAEHDIEVEDAVTAYLEFNGGATGVFTTATGEAPGVNRLEIAGTRGLAVLQADHLTLTLNAQDIREHSRTTEDAFGAPATTREEYPAGEPNPSHVAVLANFTAAALDGGALLAPAEDGLAAVELANAMVLSTWEDRRVELPLDAAAYDARLAQVIASAPARTRQIRAAKVDMAKSYA